MSRRVLATTERLVRTRPVGELALKGFARPMPAFELLGLRG